LYVLAVRDRASIVSRHLFFFVFSVALLPSLAEFCQAVLEYTVSIPSKFPSTSILKRVLTMNSFYTVRRFRHHNGSIPTTAVESPVTDLAS